MIVIHKYQLDWYSSYVPLTMYEGSTILSVQRQGDNLVLWAEENTERNKIRRNILVIMTGHLFDKKPGDVYLGTTQTKENDFVVHIYDRGEQ